MNKKKIIILLFVIGFLLTSYFVYSCPGGMMMNGQRMNYNMIGSQSMMNSQGMNHNMMNGKNTCKQNMSMKRHRYFMSNGIPANYINSKNNLEKNQQVLDNGKKLYLTNCASCHGTSGLGNGLAGQVIKPKATNIAMFSKMPMASDAYMLWTISEGGIPVKSAMPAFKTILKKNDIWKIVLYLKSM